MHRTGKTTAIILASGSGIRFRGDLPKQFAKLAGLPVVVHTLKAFQMNRHVSDIVIVTLAEYIEELWSLVGKNQLSKVRKIVVGGQTRQDSSSIGLKSCDEDTKYVLIHDAVRPFISQGIIDDLVDAVQKYRAVDTVVPSPDTIVSIDRDNNITDIPDRSLLRRGQTPQAFEFSLIRNAHERAMKDGVVNSTDDCSLVLKLGYPVRAIPGEEENIKITYPLDIQIADKLFQMKSLKIHSAPTRKELERLKGMVFVIIGGSSGIGKAIADELKKYHAKVYPLSRKVKPSLDVTNLRSIKKAFSEIWKAEQKIDFIINSAGLLLRRDVEFMDIGEWDAVYDTNIKGAYLTAKAAIPLLKQQSHGSMLFIGSSSYTRGRRGYAAYSSSKAALVNFCQALAEELLGHNIKVNVLSPSRVNTPMRFSNFGKEDPRSLLPPEKVAAEVLKIIFSDTTGSVFDIS
ncbi:MAG TPA: 2-C-methyl-D-erythritol 4-phosphate cytidylyltransferase [Thermodesulfovibrionales bacterium]|nr:2-C-methyl-D-erythritol 4-phosphate cytidylyltransferase [Thermodesulfovibrionales bacterium]